MITNNNIKFSLYGICIHFMIIYINPTKYIVEIYVFYIYKFSIPKEMMLNYYISKLIPNF